MTCDEDWEDLHFVFDDLQCGLITLSDGAPAISIVVGEKDYRVSEEALCDLMDAWKRRNYEWRVEAGFLSQSGQGPVKG